jgi:hypothetical protein
MFWKKSKSEKSKLGAASATAGSKTAKQSEPLISVKAISELLNWNSREPFDGKQTDLAFGSREGGLSAKIISAQPGDVFVAKASVVVTQAGDLQEGALGPVFMDQEQKIIGWWRGFDVAAGATQVAIENVAPPGTAFVCLGVRGPFARNASPTTAVYAFSQLTLDRKI